MITMANAQKLQFKIDRIVFDRSLWTVYYPSVVKRADENKFDTELINALDLEEAVKVARIKGKGREKVISINVMEYMRFEIRLRSTRAMQVYFNFNRYFLDKYNLVHDNEHAPLHNDNYLPLSARVKAEEFVKVYQELHKEFSKLYEEWYSKLWNMEYLALQVKGEVPVVKCTTLEVCREMYPLNVNNIRNQLQDSSIKFSTYNNATNAIHFEGDEKMITDVEYEIDGVSIKTNTCAWKYKPVGEKVMDCKLYQKSIELARFEVTLYNEQIDFDNLHPVEDLKFIINDYLEKTGLSLKETKEDRNEMICFLSHIFKIKKEVILLLLKSGSHWKSIKENKYLTSRLFKKQILLRVKKGQYMINPILVRIFQNTELKNNQSDIKLKYL